MKKESKKRIDLYDIGDGLTLMNLMAQSQILWDLGFRS